MTRQNGVLVTVLPNLVDPYGTMKFGVIFNGHCDMRVICTEGVSWEVSESKPFELGAHTYSHDELMRMAISSELDNTVVNLAEFVRTFGSRLESNFHENYRWAMNGR